MEQNNPYSERIMFGLSRAQSTQNTNADFNGVVEYIQSKA